ncbi:MAG: hypothetical protein D6730_15870 [Bacteroidetes bacterium]|nr:MAG: hypothetical protein D6730_15870 [Bacteroidota bacterium]
MLVARLVQKAKKQAAFFHVPRFSLPSCPFFINPTSILLTKLWAAKRLHPKKGLKESFRPLLRIYIE